MKSLNENILYIENNFFDGNPKTVQINKNGEIYKFRIVIKKDGERFQSNSSTLKVLGYIFTDFLFGGRFECHESSTLPRHNRMNRDNHHIHFQPNRDTMRGTFSDNAPEHAPTLPLRFPMCPSNSGVLLMVHPEESP